MDIPEHIRSALHNFDRTAWRRQRRWERRVPARFLDDLEDRPPGARGVPWSEAHAPDDDDPELLAVLKEFEEQNRDLLERYRSTPTCEKRSRGGLRKELAHRLKRDARKLGGANPDQPDRPTREVQVFVPRQDGTDWADIWLASLAKDKRAA